MRFSTPMASPMCARRIVQDGCRGRKLCPEAGRQGRAQDLLARHHPQIRCRRRGAQSRKPRCSAGSRRGDARARRPRLAPKASIEGFIVQEMIQRPASRELILGMAVDRQFGPFLLFGRGGTAAEVIGDRALALPPLNLALAHEMMCAHAGMEAAAGLSRHPAGRHRCHCPDAGAAVATRRRLRARSAELDINPLLADANGVIALDARVRVARTEPTAPSQRFSISPYPKELEHVEHVDGMGELLLRPIRPEDAPALERMFAQLLPEDVRLRFFTPMRAAAARACSPG